MLVFHSHCQMGNQMFIYACARSLAKKRNTFYCLSEINHLRFFELSGEDGLLNKLKYLFFRLQNFIPFAKYDKKHLQDNRIDYSEQMLGETNKNIWYYGYFQGLNYFYENEQDIRKCFKIKPAYSKKFEGIFSSLPIHSKKVIAVHFRRKDYKTFGPDFLDGPDLTLPFSYYHIIIKNENMNESFFVFLSDDMTGIKEEFGYVGNAYFSDNDAITDLQFLINADACV